MSKTLIWIVSGDSITSTADPTFARCWVYQYLGLTPTYINDDVFGPNAPFHQGCRVYDSGNVLMKNMALTGSGLTNALDISLWAIKDQWIDPVAAVRSIHPAGSPAPRDRIYMFTCALGSNDGAKFSGDPSGGGHPDWPVTNTVPEYIDAMVQTMAARRAAGFSLIGLTTLLPRSDTSFLNETDRATYNSSITAPGWAAAHGIDFILDFASDSIMGNPANLPANNGGITTWYNDNAHPTTAGHARFVPIAAAILDPIIAAL